VLTINSLAALVQQLVQRFHGHVFGGSAGSLDTLATGGWRGCVATALLGASG
jgi:hypothetical protein